MFAKWLKLWTDNIDENFLTLLHYLAFKQESFWVQFSLFETKNEEENFQQSVFEIFTADKLF